MQRAERSSLRPLRALAPYVRPYVGHLALATVMLFSGSAAMLALPTVLRDLIDRGITLRDAAASNGYFAKFFAVALAYGLFTSVRGYLLTWLGERVVADLRDAVFRHVVRMELSFFEKTRSGEILSRLSVDTMSLQMIASVGVSVAAGSIVNLCGALVMLSLTSPSLLGLLLILIPLVVVPLHMMGKYLRRHSRDVQAAMADSSGVAGETLAAIQVVQAFALEKVHGKRFSDAVQAAFRATMQRSRLGALIGAVAAILVFGAITLVLWVGTRNVFAGRMTSGELSQFLLYAAYFGVSTIALSRIWGELVRASGSLEQLMELHDRQPVIEAPSEPAMFPMPRRGQVSFDAVEFRYPTRPQTCALENLTLEIPTGEKLALVGPSGAGKSTVFNLLLRFYDPTAGAIRIDGVDIARARPEDLRAHFGLVPQDTILFGVSIWENIRYGRPDATAEEIEAAARAAAVDLFLHELPDGYQTVLGERGSRLSGGQRQRVAIARAVLKNPPILLLDEATSALDSESEHTVQHALERLMKGRTTLIIAHRLATVLQADRIVVLDKGRVVASGSHAELLKSCPLYARLAAMQFRDTAH